LRAQPLWPPRLAVICAKHLCGAGTDLALRSVARAVEVSTHIRESGRDPEVVFAMVLAPCCHHLCEWPAYVNQVFIASSFIDMEPRVAFAKMIAVAPWATEAHKPVNGESAYEVAFRERRRTIGVKAKRILDIGRAVWLLENLHFGSVVASTYTDDETSPENLLIMARR